MPKTMRKMILPVVMMAFIGMTSCKKSGVETTQTTQASPKLSLMSGSVPSTDSGAHNAIMRALIPTRDTLDPVDSIFVKVYNMNVSLFGQSVPDPVGMRTTVVNALIAGHVLDANRKFKKGSSALPFIMNMPTTADPLLQSGLRDYTNSIIASSANIASATATLNSIKLSNPSDINARTGFISIREGSFKMYSTEPVWLSVYGSWDWPMYDASGDAYGYYWGYIVFGNRVAAQICAEFFSECWEY